ncbi:MAG: hypothetical protein C6Y22_27165 [Hapalosiphonaceae cyanobacterium JJU2]|nr:MAG: hypothetical protein C6Y22_27165 [Hapalosiphonaceae cyanobacterium JJU2]TBR60242.1 hypothetical protein B4U84_04985 [Westiellopsis prolifica IICB1]
MLYFILFGICTQLLSHSRRFFCWWAFQQLVLILFSQSCLIVLHIAPKIVEIIVDFLLENRLPKFKTK